MMGEATSAAREARDAAERAAREQPTRWEAVLAALTTLVTTVIDALTTRVDSLVEHARRTGEDVSGRILRAFGLAIRHVVGAVALGFAAGILLIVALVVLAVGSVELLNAAFGRPYGTIATGAVFLALAGVATLATRKRLQAVLDLADTLAPRKPA